MGSELRECWDMGESRYQERIDILNATIANQLEQIVELTRDRDLLRGMVNGLTDRVGAQSELLARRAERARLEAVLTNIAAVWKIPYDKLIELYS